MNENLNQNKEIVTFAVSRVEFEKILEKLESNLEYDTFENIDKLRNEINCLKENKSILLDECEKFTRKNDLLEYAETIIKLENLKKRLFKEDIK